MQYKYYPIMPSILDIILAVMFTVSIIHGYRSGLFKQLFSLAGIIGGIILAYQYYDDLCLMVAPAEKENVWAGIISFMVILLAVFLVMVLFGKIITGIFDVSLLGWLNRGLGALFSLAQAVLFIGLFCLGFDWFNNQFELVGKEVLNSSVLYNFLCGFMRSLLPPFFE